MATTIEVDKPEVARQAGSVSYVPDLMAGIASMHPAGLAETTIIAAYLVSAAFTTALQDDPGRAIPGPSEAPSFLARWSPSAGHIGGAYGFPEGLLTRVPSRSIGFFPPEQSFFLRLGYRQLFEGKRLEQASLLRC